MKRLSIGQFLGLTGCVVLMLCVLTPIVLIAYGIWNVTNAEQLSLRFTKFGTHEVDSLQLKNSDGDVFSFTAAEIPRVLSKMNADSLEHTLSGEFSRGSSPRLAESLQCTWTFSDRAVSTPARIACFDSKPYLLFEISEYDYDGSDMITFCLKLHSVLGDDRVDEFMAGVGSGSNEFTTK